MFYHNNIFKTLWTIENQGGLTCESFFIASIALIFQTLCLQIILSKNIKNTSKGSPVIKGSDLINLYKHLQLCPSSSTVRKTVWETDLGETILEEELEEILKRVHKSA